MADAVVEAAGAFRRCFIPLFVSLSIYFIGFGILLFGTLVHTLGSIDRYASGVYISSVREIAVWVTTMIFAGIAGAAVTSDLGARKIREELDALATLGVDKDRSLVVPRVMAMTLAAPVLGVVALLIIIAVNYLLAPPIDGFSRAVFRDSLQHSAIPLDLYAFILKMLIIGFFVGVVSCQKGLASHGGAEGVGRAVNQTVVISFFGIWLINTLFNLAYLTTFPQVSVLRG